jgi:hypothetical protein
MLSFLVYLLSTAAGFSAGLESAVDSLVLVSEELLFLFFSSL